MDSSFSNGGNGGGNGPPGGGNASPPTVVPQTDTPRTDTPQIAVAQTAAPQVVAPRSPATERFHSCRWRKAAEDGIPDHCTHRDVLPMAGTAGFVPDSWCADCQFYKAKRTPRKRQEEPPVLDNWRRW